MRNDRFIKEARIDWDKIDEDSYLRGIPVISSTDSVLFDNNIVFFVGENGTGKSTLLEAVAVAYGFNPEGGTKNYNFSTFESHSELYRAVSRVKGTKRPRSSYFLRAESFYNVATKAEDYREPGEDPNVYYARYGGKSLHEQSHGESFLEFIQSVDAPGLYFMDEPEAALSPQRQLTLLIYLVRMAQRGSQFIIATHSPILLGTPGADIYSFDDGRVRKVSYEETDSYQITKMFIENRSYLLERLLRDEEESENESF